MLYRIYLFLMILPALAVGEVPSTELDVQAEAEIKELKAPMYRPLVERYLMDEVKTLRVEVQALRVEMAEKIAQSRLDATDRSMSYMTNTVNNIFLILTAIASLVALFGWKSVKDAKEQTKRIVQQRLESITEEYTKKLTAIESEMQQRSADILKNQERITRSNEIHALWRRSQLEENTQAKVDIYDQILNLERNNVEALTYKADAVLDLGEREWALNLCNQALELDNGYAYSYWQRACVNAELGNLEPAIGDISKAIRLSPTLTNDIESEKSFDAIRTHERFKAFVQHELMPLKGAANKERV